MTKLESEFAEFKVEFRARMVDLEARVRLDAVAEAWLAGAAEVREGDYFLLDKDTPTRLMSVESASGKWTYYGSTVFRPSRARAGRV